MSLAPSHRVANGPNNERHTFCSSSTRRSRSPRSTSSCLSLACSSSMTRRSSSFCTRCRSRCLRYARLCSGIGSRSGARASVKTLLHLNGSLNARSSGWQRHDSVHNNLPCTWASAWPASAPDTQQDIICVRCSSRITCSALPCAGPFRLPCRLQLLLLVRGVPGEAVLPLRWL